MFGLLPHRCVKSLQHFIRHPGLQLQRFSKLNFSLHLPEQEVEAISKTHIKTINQTSFVKDV